MNAKAANSNAAAITKCVMEPAQITIARCQPGWAK
jgi:hypothetical protein